MTSTTKIFCTVRDFASGGKVHVRPVSRVALLLLVILLTGCAGEQRRSEVVKTAKPKSSVPATAFDNWRLIGKIGMQRDGKGFNAEIQWRQAYQDFNLRISAPLNGGTFMMAGGERGVSLTTPKGETYQARDAESLMQRHLGWTIPLAGARYWVRGIPDPALSFTQAVRDDEDRLTDFVQAGWRVSVLDYSIEHGMALPKRLFLTRDEIKVRFAIRAWDER